MTVKFKKNNTIIKQHPSYEQVVLDVDRCSGRLQNVPKYNSHPNSNRLKDKLTKLIVTLLIKKPGLHYYQGFHDVCLTYMAIYGYQLALKKMEKLIDSHFSIFMQPTMNETQEFLALIPIIIGLHDVKLQDFLEQAEVGTIFALSWVITWFSHVLANESDIETIFNYLEQSEDAHLILYLCAEIVIYKKDELLKLDPEMSTVHHFLSQIPRQQELPLDELMIKASQTFKKWPPDLLKRKLDNHRRAKLRIHNYNLVTNMAHRFVPTLMNVVTSNSRTALIVLVVASALVFQYDRWLK